MVSATTYHLPIVRWAFLRQWVVVVLCAVALAGAALAHFNHVPDPAGSYSQQAMPTPDDGDDYNPDTGGQVFSNCSQHSCSIWVFALRDTPPAEIRAATPSLGSSAHINGQETAPPFHPPKA